MTTGPLRRVAERWRRYWPGILISFTIAAAATFLSEHYRAPAMLFALLIGMAFHFLNTEDPCKAGIAFTGSRLLRVGVACLGARVTFQDLASLGPTPVFMTPVLIALTMGAGLLLAKAMRRSTRFGIISGGAVAICGASAALAISAAFPRRNAESQGAPSDENDTLFTVIAVTSLSTLAMIGYPILFAALDLPPHIIGYLLGATIHDVAQVVGAGYAVSDEAGAIATYVKLLRVACLPVVVIAVALIAARGGGGVRTFPWFAVAFAAILLLNSFGLIPDTVRALLASGSTWLLVAAIAALGMKTSLRELVRLGPWPIALVVAETLILLLAALAVARFIPHLR